MKKYTKKTLVWLLKGVLFTVGVTAFYFLSAFVLTLIPGNPGKERPAQGIEIFVSSNGVHTDIVVPVQTALFNWEGFIPPSDFRPEAVPFSYISFGWGDKGFYLDTPTWSDLKFSTAFNAMFCGAATAMHVAYFTGKPAESSYIRRLVLSPEQYSSLVKYIRGSFREDDSGKCILIDCCRYTGLNDSFYEARGSYSLFKTCNVWTNNALKACDVKTALWAPFEKCVMYRLR
jgi:uncharacterized protein (TIGR02117 family)